MYADVVKVIIKILVLIISFLVRFLTLIYLSELGEARSSSRVPRELNRAHQGAPLPRVSPPRRLIKISRLVEAGVWLSYVPTYTDPPDLSER